MTTSTPTVDAVCRILAREARPLTAAEISAYLPGISRHSVTAACTFAGYGRIASQPRRNLPKLYTLAAAA